MDLPSYPEVALRVQRVRADTNANADRVVRVIGSEPVLAARLGFDTLCSALGS